MTTAQAMLLGAGLTLLLQIVAVWIMCWVAARGNATGPKESPPPRIGDDGLNSGG